LRRSSRRPRFSARRSRKHRLWARGNKQFAIGRRASRRDGCPGAFLCDKARRRGVTVDKTKLACAGSIWGPRRSRCSTRRPRPSTRRTRRWCKRARHVMTGRTTLVIRITVTVLKADCW
jgi:hypothetical protein